VYQVLDLGAAVTRADIPVLCERLHALVRDTGTPVVRCQVGGLVEPGVAAVEALARLRLTARRLDVELPIDGAGSRLRQLVALAGLSALLGLQP